MFTTDNSYNYKKRVIIEQKNYGRFTIGVWNFIKSVELKCEDTDLLRLILESKIETMKLDEIKAMVNIVVKG